MEAAQPHHPPTHLAGEGEALEEARRQLALLQRRIEVEEALERVRARAMAMHSSDDIASATAVVFRELDKLGIVTIRCGIAIIDGANKMIEAWVATTTTEGEVVQVLGQFPAETHPLLSGTFDAWKREDPFFSYELVGDDVQRYYQAITPMLPLPEQEAPIPRQFFAIFFFPEGGLYAYTDDPLSEEAIQVLQRFTRVFSLTYRRYLDLKEAEARAREAVQQASLDRVRAEIASMRTADDLQRITPLIWTELTTLGVPFFRCGIFIVDEGREEVEMFLSNNYGKQLAQLRLPFDIHPLIRDALTAWRNQQLFRDQWDQKTLVEWVDFLMTRGQVTRSEDYLDRSGPPESLAVHLLPFKQGLLYVGSEAPLLDDQIDLIQTLADAFAVAYARYEDFRRLEVAKADVEAALDDLKATQQQLIHAEKMASLGALTAGIAHEIKNPLNFVNNFAVLSTELTDEIAEELDAHPDKTVAEIRANLDELLGDLRLNTEKINEHGQRADSIVRAMMQHAQGGEGQRRAVGVNALLKEYVNLAFHGMRAKSPEFNVTIEQDYDEAVGEVEMVLQEIGRVFINLLNNAFYAVHERALSQNGQFAPTVTVSTRQGEGQVEIRVADNGSGIAEEIREKIFEPFFTTKPAGQGTGLGLSLSYDIVTQGHGGTLTVESIEGEGATFVITLPMNSPNTG